MQGPNSVMSNNQHNTSIRDPVSDNQYFVEDGSFCVKSPGQSEVLRYSIKHQIEGEYKAKNCLKFKKISSSSLVFAPSGKFVTSKSDRIHEVDFSNTFTQGVAMWDIVCTSNCLSLIVGVKNVHKKKEHCLQFTVQNTTKISFKLDMCGEKLKGWIYKPLSVAQKKIKLSEHISEWTPFIRFKGVGVTVFLSDFSKDPEQKVSLYNIFFTRNTNVEPRLKLSTKPVRQTAQKYSIKLLDENSILLYSHNQLRVIRRDEREKEFVLDRGSFGGDGNFYISFQKNELEILKKVGFEIVGQEQDLFCGKSIEEWKDWMISSFTLLDTKKNENTISHELYCRTYEILLSKVQTFKGFIKDQLRCCPALESDLEANWGHNISLMPIPETRFTIPKSVKLNHEPPFKITKQIKSIFWTEHFLLVLINENDRIIILNREDSLFKIGEINLKRGFKKQNELNQYQKELDFLESASSNEPSIYKILKNCLKYADKVKLPEKPKKIEIEQQKKKEKQKEKEKEKEKQKSKSKIDKSLVNTLIGMGFSEAQANAALIQGKNNLEKAIQIIFSQPMKQTSKTPTKNVPVSKLWQCPQCTLVNDNSSLACAACQLPKPLKQEKPKLQLIEQQQVMEQKQAQKQAPKQEEEVESKTIQANLQNLYVWQLGLGFSPLVIVATFKGKLRMRLFGPNPKYYSLFYTRDEQFVDLTKLTTHNEAYQINQKPVRSQFFLGTTAAEQKESGYGWISIEDSDIQIDGKIETVWFQKGEKQKDNISFYINVEGNDKNVRFNQRFLIKISISKVYAEKKRCLSWSKAEAKKTQAIQEDQNKFTKREKQNSNIIPKNGYITVDLSRIKNKPQSVSIVESLAQVSDRINHSKSYLPVRASHENGSAYITTLVSALQPGKKQLILQHLQNKSMRTQYIVLQKLGKNVTNYEYFGFITFSEEPSKKSIYRLKFELEKGKKRFYIETKEIRDYSYVKIQLHQKQHNQSAIVEEISIVGLIGDEIEKVNNKNLTFTNLNNKIELKIIGSSQSSQKLKTKVEAQILNSQYDLRSLTNSQLWQYVEDQINNQSRLDVKFKIYNFSKEDLVLESINLDGWETLRKTSFWCDNNEIQIFGQNYTQLLQNLILNGDFSNIEQIGSPQHKDYFSQCLNEKLNFTNFFKHYVIGGKITRDKKSKLLSYLHQIGQYLQQIHEKGNLNYRQLLQEALLEGQTSQFSLEIIFQICKHFKLQQSLLLDNLVERLTKADEESLKQISKNPRKSLSGDKQSHIFSRHIQQNAKFYRKFTIDLINVYKIKRIDLSLEKCTRKSDMKITVKYFNKQRDWVSSFQQFYPDFIWEQLSICPFTEEFEKNVKISNKDNKKFNCLSLPINNRIKARYLEIEISFTVQPNLGSTKIVQKIPQSEIFPSVFGDYEGEDETILDIFKNLEPSSLIFMKNIGNQKKFTVNNLKNTFFYETEQGGFQIKSEAQQNKNQAGFNMISLEIEQLISRGKFCHDEKILGFLINSMTRFHRTPLSQKIASLIRSFVKQSSQSSLFIIKNKLPSQHYFNYIIKQSSLRDEDILSIISNDPTDVEFQNVILYSKYSPNKNNSIFSKINEESIKRKRIQDTAILHQKHGWVQNTVNLLDQLLSARNTKLFNRLVILSQNNTILANFTKKLLETEGFTQQFVFCFNTLLENQRKVKQSQIHGLLQSLLSNIKQSIENQDQEGDYDQVERFLLLTSAINTFICPQQLISTYIKIFGSMPQKQNIIQKFLSIKQLKQGQSISQLLKLIINLLHNYLIQKSKNSETLKLVSDILLFIFRNEPNSPTMDAIISSRINLIGEVYSVLLLKELNFGSDSASKLIESQSRLKMSIGTYLANFIVKLATGSQKTKSVINLSQKCLRNIIQWLFMNESINPEQRIPRGHFKQISQSSWILLSENTRLHFEKTIQIFSQELEKFEKEGRKIKNKVFSTWVEKKILNTSCNYLEKVEKQEAIQKLFHILFKKHMQKIINKQNFDLQEQIGKQKSTSFEDKEIVNQFELQNQTVNKPKDWLLYRNGAKNSVFKFQYPKTQQNSYEIILKLSSKNTAALSKIIIGFEQTETSQQSYSMPQEITVEGGDRLDDLKFIGKFTQIPDNHYINYSVRVYGLSCIQFQSSKLSSSLNKYPDVRFLKFILKSPEQGFATDALNVSDPTKAKNFGSSINFLSIHGFSTKIYGHPEIESIISFVKKLSQFKNKQSLRKLLADEQNVKIFKESLINWAKIMNSGSSTEDIHKFIMRVCQVNTQIGNETIEKYLNLDNPQTCAKIVSQIILSNQQSFPDRIARLNSFINFNLESVRSLQAFLNKFSQIIYMIQKNKNKKSLNIEIEIDSKKIEKIIQDGSSSISFGKYLCCIFNLEQPFYSKGLNHEAILQKLHDSKQSLDNQILIALVVSDKNSRSWFMQKQYLLSIYQTLKTKIQSKSEDYKSIVKHLQTLYSLCFNPNIKNIINKNNYNISIFELFVSSQFSYMLVGENNAQLREAFVNFITISVLGSQNEMVVAQILKQSLISNAVQQNKYFVGQVFLPILNSFSKTTICAHGFDTEQNKMVIEPNFKTGQKKDSQKKDQISKFRLPTNIISQKIKMDIFEKIKEKTKADGGNFNLAANHGKCAQGIFNLIEKSIKGSDQSILLLFKGTSKSNKTETLGVFFKDQEVRSLPIKWNEDCFVFIVRQKQQLQFIEIKKQVGKKCFSFRQQSMKQLFGQQCDLEQSKILQINYENVPFCEVSQKDVFSKSYINSDLLKGTKNGQYKIELAEYWLFEPILNTKPSKEKDQISLTSEILSLYNPSFFQPAYESRNILRLLRSNKIYEFPTSLKFSELRLSVQVMKCKLKQNKESNFKFRNIQAVEISEEKTISDLMKKSEEPILDILIQTNNIINIIDFQSSNKVNTTTYLPRKGIMKHFQEINGVTSMIKVIKKSLEGWKNKDRRQKWGQYVQQLQKFSSFPHFFGMYLKDNETFDLLFKLLSGLPDTEQDKKWDELEAKSSQKLLKIVSDILSMDKTTEFREYAIKHDFFKTILGRVKILTGLFIRQWKQADEMKENEQISPSKQVEDDGTKKIVKKKGVGYGNDSSSNTKWMKGATQAQLMKQFQVIEIILNIIENFIDLKHWKVPKIVLQNIYQSALLPYLEEALRAGTLLQISKIPAKFKLVFKILRTLSRNSHLVPVLMPIHKNYQPKQIQSLQSLIKSLQNTANIFLSCLKTNSNPSNAEKVSEQLAKDIIQTAKFVQQAVQDYIQAHNNEGDQNDMKDILELPLDKKYKHLLKDLRFDYIDMKDGSKMKHHYSTNYNPNYTPNQNKMIRLAQQLADISTALPYEHTNGIFVRCDKDRVDFMQALIMGANGTPYGHGAFLFDIYFDDTYPNSPPKVNLTTTGHGKVRFNPNLYACGKVCLSLLGTWRGSASQNWDAKVSTLLQVLVSIQAIIMSEEVYFNEPGFEGEQGTTQGEKKNEAYSNIVRYCNIKFAMIDNMRNPPKGFEHVIRRHFYLKQHQILDECKKWLLYAEKRQANYINLVNDHNSSWSAEFKKSKNQYKDMLEKAIEQLEQQFKKLPVPSIHDILSKKAQKKKKKKIQNKDQLKKLEEQAQQEIDVEYEKKDKESNGKQIDINDEKVKDRWSRYIGAMGIDAVSKQSKADILVFGLGPLSLEVVKNLVLSGCRKLTIIDEKKVSYEDLSGGFFYNESDIGKKRIQCIYKIRQLNVYVKIDTTSVKELTDDALKTYSLVFVTQMSYKQQFTINERCRAHNVKYISADFCGAHSRILNDFGDKFEVLDKNGEEPVEVVIKSITSSQKGVVTLLDGSKHPYEDGEFIHLKNIQGMSHKEDKTKSINGTIHKIRTINKNSFEIGDTTIYQPYIRNGLAKNVKTPIYIKFKSMKQVFSKAAQNLPIDENLQFYDFTKMDRNKQIHFCFVALDTFVQENGRFPLPWNIVDAEKMVSIFEKAYGEQVKDEVKSYVRRFSFTCQGYLPPLAAYLGGFISQEIIKAITQKYKPLDSVFYIDSDEMIPQQFDVKDEKIVEKVISGKDHRDRGFEIVVGKDLLDAIKNSTSFMIGSGAIGCELLKNFAMIGLGTGQKGKITLTDPDHIQNSNLNRQFLFRQKHISKPKSRTAAASVALMNSNLKGHISALLERVSESTKSIFSNKFFESLTFVANALDNVAARRYVDQRCVENKIPLFQSGTLGPKGHIQVIIPYKTESYGSQNDPVQQGQIPHCTLKMFPEQTLHCVEWARDIFGKKFSLQPKAFIKLKDSKFKPQKDDIKSINECLVMGNKGPKCFEDCINYAVTKFYKYFRDDIMQLLYTYPLTAKTKDGQPFWKLPKRPPTPILKFDPENILHCTFVSSMAVLVAKVYKIPYPKNFRQQKQRKFIAKSASQVVIADFVPSDQKAKSILKQTAEQKKQNKQKQEEEKQKQVEITSQKNQLQLHEEFIKASKQMQVEAQQFEKDNDQNGHIDFIYSMANLRAINYKLDEMDWITTKLKAGRIVPALATTTTCVAGLQTLEICKYMKKLKLDLMKNSFLNLAVPSLSMSEPGDVKKIKINDKVQVSLWDRWEIPCNQNTTFGEVYDELRKRYELNPTGVLQGMSRIDTSKSIQGKKQFLSSKLIDKLDKQDDYIDIVVLFTKSEEDEKLIENIPPVRLIFQSKK